MQQSLAQRLSIEQLQYDVEEVAVCAEVEDGDEVRMIEQPERTRLLVKTGHQVGAADRGGGEQLDSHVAPQLRVAGTIDLPHPPRPQGREGLQAPHPPPLLAGPYCGNETDI